MHPGIHTHAYMYLLTFTYSGNSHNTGSPGEDLVLYTVVLVCCRVRKPLFNGLSSNLHEYSRGHITTNPNANV